MASTMVAPVQRRPFAEIGAARLGQLSARKNTQNAITESILNEAGKLGHKQPAKTQFTFSHPIKRPLQSISTDSDDDASFDAENLDPSLTSPKRSKGLDGFPAKPSMYNLKVQTAVPYTPTLAHSAPSTTPDLPISASRTAPAGRSPKHKRVGILSRKRTSASPFKAILPPAFGSHGSPSSGLGFSIDAALQGTLSSRTPASESITPASSSQPKGWFFAIHEDTAEEEAGILMEHSCLTLDISSEDEEGPSRRDREDKGKENVPPEDHQAMQVEGQTSGLAGPLKQRRRVDPDAMTEEERSPLGSLPAEDFYSEGLDATSVVVVVESEDAGVATSLPEVEQESTSAKLESEEQPGTEASSVSEPSEPPAETPAFIIAEDPAATA